MGRATSTRCRPAAAVALGAIALLSGCGGGSKPAGPAGQAEQAFNQIIAQERAGNPAVCDRFTPAFIQRQLLERTSPADALRRCRKDVPSNASFIRSQGTLKVTSTTVRGNTATIGATGSDGSKGTYTLVRQGGVWKVSGLTRRQ